MDLEKNCNLENGMKMSKITFKNLENGMKMPKITFKNLEFHFEIAAVETLSPNLI